MIYFTLPNLDYNFKMNQYLLQYYREHKAFFLDDIKFIAYRGAFNYSYFSGDINNCIGEELHTYPYFSMIAQSASTALRFDMSNIFLTPNDFKDRKLNTILKICENGSNYIEVSNLEFLEYLKDKYPYYKYVFSHNADLINEVNPAIINAIIEEGSFDLVEIPIRLNHDDEFLREIKDKSKIELCLYKHNFCNEFQSCSYSEQEMQYNFHNKSCMQSCHSCLDFSKKDRLIPMKDIREYYLPKGVKHFRIPTIGYANHDRSNFLLFFIDYFIKDEFKEAVYKDFIINKEAMI